MSRWVWFSCAQVCPFKTVLVKIVLNLGVLFGNEIAEIMLTETEGLNNVIVSAYTGCTSFNVSTAAEGTSITYVITTNCQYIAASQTFYVSLSVERS